MKADSIKLKSSKCLFGERYKQALRHCKISQAEICRRTDLDRSHLSHILSGDKMPDHWTTLKLLLAFPELNARWALTGWNVAAIPIDDEGPDTKREGAQ